VPRPATANEIARKAMRVRAERIFTRQR